MSHTQILPCNSLDEVRREIDRIDHSLVALIAKCGGYVRQAARFKADAADIPAPQRVAEVIARVTGLAKQMGAEPAVVEATWRAMINAFIHSERTAHAALHPPS